MKVAIYSYHYWGTWSSFQNPYKIWRNENKLKNRNQPYDSITKMR